MEFEISAPIHPFFPVSPLTVPLFNGRCDRKCVRTVDPWGDDHPFSVLADQPSLLSINDQAESEESMLIGELIRGRQEVLAMSVFAVD